VSFVIQAIGPRKLMKIGFSTLWLKRESELSAHGVRQLFDRLLVSAVPHPQAVFFRLHQARFPQD
jgi:hypothetical protein